MRRSLICAIAVICALSSFLPCARASGLADEAELHFQLGAERYIAKDYRGALEHFLASNRLVANRNVLFNIAKTFEQLKRYPDAYRYYSEVLTEERDATTRKDIDSALARIAPNVAVLRVVTSPPGATIFVDRRDLGSRGLAPRSLGLVEGRYKIIAELEGYASAESGVIDAKAGQEVQVQLELARILGKLRISGRPGTEVRLDKEEALRCVVPCEIDSAPGLHTVNLSLPGHQSASRQVNVVASETVSLDGELAPLLGAVVVNADERGALVELDGKAVGFTPAVIDNVVIGPRHLKVSLGGYKSVERDIVVEPNRQTEVLDVSLIPIQEVTAASRVAESVENAPGSVSIIGVHELRAFAYPTIAEAVRGLRGISLSWDGLYSSLSVRGLGAPNDYGNRVLVLADGASTNDNILASSYVGFDARADLGDLTRIEVVRGPGSILYGTGAVSGVVNLVTRNHDAPTSVFGGVGVAGQAGQGRVGFQLNLGERRGAWASVSGARSDGYPVTFSGQDESGAVVERIAHGVDRFEAKTLAGAAWWGPVSVQWLYTSRNQGVPLGAFGVKFDDLSTRYVDGRFLGEAKVEVPLSARVDFFARAHVNRYDYRGLYQYEESKAEETYKGLWGGVESRARLHFFEHALALSIGGEMQRHFETSVVGQTISDGESETYLDSDRPYSQGAAYVLVDAVPFEWLKLQAGARLDVYGTFGATLNPRLASIFRITPRDILKLIAGRAFRAPSVYELYYNDGGVSQIAATADGAKLGPEIAYSGELEYTRRLSEDWSVILSAHSMYALGVIETRGAATAEDPLRYVNSNEPLITAGGDLEVRREWRQGWMLSATYGALLARYVDTPEGSGTSSTRLPNAPVHLAALRGIAPLVPSLAVLAVRVSLDAPRRVNLATDERSKLGVVTDFVLSGEAQRYGLSYAVGLYNALDWKYSQPVTEALPANTMPQPGRSIRASIGLTY